MFIYFYNRSYHFNQMFISSIVHLWYKPFITKLHYISECPLPGPVPNGRLLGNLNAEFSTRRLDCDQGYVPAYKQRHIVCKGGVWSPTAFCYLFGMYFISCLIGSHLIKCSYVQGVLLAFESCDQWHLKMQGLYFDTLTQIVQYVKYTNELPLQKGLQKCINNVIWTKNIASTKEQAPPCHSRELTRDLSHLNLECYL